MDEPDFEGSVSERLISQPEKSKDPGYSELYAPHQSHALFMVQKHDVRR